MNHALLLAAAIGFVTGLRSMSTPALAAWAARLGWINLHGTPLSFMASGGAVGVWSLLAISEFVADVLPMTPARIVPASLLVRVVTGGLSGACLAAAGGGPLWLGAALGIVGAMAGAFAGYYTRRGLVRGLKVKDILIAIPEDIVALGLGYLIVR